MYQAWVVRFSSAVATSLSLLFLAMRPLLIPEHFSQAPAQFIIIMARVAGARLTAALQPLNSAYQQIRRNSAGGIKVPCSLAISVFLCPVIQIKPLLSKPAPTSRTGKPFGQTP